MVKSGAQYGVLKKFIFTVAKKAFGMGHFSITLPNEQQADVRHGIERKINSLLDLLPWRQARREEKRGYIVKVDTGSDAQATYRIFKTMEGQWLPHEDDEMTASIKAAIDMYETQNQTIPES